MAGRLLCGSLLLLVLCHVAVSLPELSGQHEEKCEQLCVKVSRTCGLNNADLGLYLVRGTGRDRPRSSVTGRTSCSGFSFRTPRPYRWAWIPSAINVFYLIFFIYLLISVKVFTCFSCASLCTLIIVCRQFGKAVECG